MRDICARPRPEIEIADSCKREKTENSEGQGYVAETRKTRESGCLFPWITRCQQWERVLLHEIPDRPAMGFKNEMYLVSISRKGFGQHRNSKSILTHSAEIKMAAQHIHARSRVYYETDAGTFNSPLNLGSWNALTSKDNTFSAGDTLVHSTPTVEELEEVSEQHHLFWLMLKGRRGLKFSTSAGLIIVSTKTAWNISMKWLPVENKNTQAQNSSWYIPLLSY